MKEKKFVSHLKKKVAELTKGEFGDYYTLKKKSDHIIPVNNPYKKNEKTGDEKHE